MPAQKSAQADGGGAVRRRLGELEERLLGEVLGVRGVAAHPPGEVVDEPLVPLDQSGEGTRVPRLAPALPECFFLPRHGTLLHDSSRM